jgi:ligand-binding sensor domain-containing protein/signal transduction histidine kinase
MTNKIKSDRILHIVSIISIFLFGQLSNVFAQKIKFELISSQNGLSQGSIVCMAQDKKGFMWFGTYDGLNRYDGYHFKIYKNEPNNPGSLSNNFIRSILVDNHGYLWAGTQGGGICRFDSENDDFVQYHHDPENPNSLSHDNIYQIIQDRFGSIWIATWGGGLNRIIPDPKNGFQGDMEFIKYQNNPNQTLGLPDNRVSSLYEDESGYLWIGTRKGIAVFDLNMNKFIRSFSHSASDPYSLSSDNVTKLSGDKFGNIWIATWGSGLNMFDPKKQKFYRFKHNPDNTNSLSYDIIMALFIDKSDNLWIGTWGGGLNKLPLQNINTRVLNNDISFIKYQNQPNDISSVAGNSIYSIFEDRSGVLWIGSDWNGISKYDQNQSKFAHYEADPDDENALHGNTVLALFRDDKKNLWIGTLGKGLNKYDERTGKYVHYLKDPSNPYSISDNAAHAILQDKSGRLWIGTEAGLNLYNYEKDRFKKYYFNADDPNSTHINSMYEDKNGYIWMGSWESGLAKFDPNSKKFEIFKHDPEDPHSLGSNIIYCISEDSEGRLWIGTDMGGLNLYDKANNNFIRFVHDDKDSSSIIDNKIITMLHTSANEFWIGTTAGLDKMVWDNGHEKKPVFKHYVAEEGLMDKAIQSISEDNNGNLWIPSGNYLLNLNPKTGKIKSFDAYSRLQAGEFTMNAIYKESDTGYMYIGSVKGYNIFHPDSIEYNSIAPQTVITDFKISNKSVGINQRINDNIILTKSIVETNDMTLSYKDDVLSFEFAALHYNSPEDNNYAYMMEGFEEEWNYVGNKREATYTNLDPGEYVFRVKSSNNDGIWNEEDAKIAITITPPFWETAWFRILAFIMIISSIYMVYKYRVRSIEAHRKELEMKVKERTQQLSEKAEALIEAKKETDNILENVKEGFFLLDKNFQISSQYSAILETIFYMKKLAQLNIIEFLADKIPEDEVENAKNYLELMFDYNIDDTQIADLNPLVDIEFSFKEKDVIIKKYLNFTFRRIKSKNSKKIELIVTVRDVTEQILLSQQLKEEEARREKLLQLILSILNVEPKMLSDFSESTNRELTFIDNIMNHDEIDNYHNLLVKVQRSIHLVKGNAKLLNIDYFANQAHEFEDYVSDLLKTKEIKEKDIEPLRKRLLEIQNGMTEMESIIEKIGKVLSHKHKTKRTDAGMLLHSLENLINSFSNDLGKKIKFDYKNFKRDIIPERYHLLIKEVLIQLVRNSISHGIETPEERQKLKKPEYGVIKISTFKHNDSVGLKFRDDGRGLQLEKLKQRAIESGKWAPEEVEKWDKQQLADLIFASGITTSDKVDMTSGRGVGMDSVKHRLVENNGKIIVHFDQDKYCEFEILLPTAA